MSDTKLSHDQVVHVAGLARLDLEEAEIDGLIQDLSSILSYVDKLTELDTTKVEPTSHVVAMRSAFRQDEVTNTPSPEDALANAPRRDDNYFVVPSIIE
jgi:aspartyl-tRNA(Asn)/glutamyl-tRNA(Gln) amidotransferase subunit C